MIRRVCHAFLVPLFLCFAVSCAPRGSLETLPALERSWPPQEQIFRHAVRIDFPEPHPAFSFDGIMRLRNDATGPEIRVVCLTPPGLTVCDMTLTPAGYRTDALHPSLAKVPHVADHIARCVGSIWFAALPVAARGQKTAPLRETYGRTILEHITEDDGRRVVKARGPDAFWTVSYLPGVPHPSRILFRDESEGYAVTIRFIGGQ